MSSSSDRADPRPRRSARPKRFGLGTWILIAMVAGALAGALLGESAAVVAPLGDLFIKLMKMLVVPLVAVSIVGGAASLGATRSAGRLGIGTFGYYLLTTAAAVTIGLAAGAIFEPGSGLDVEAMRARFSPEYADRGAQPGFWEVVLGFVPENPFAAFSAGNILQVLLFSLLLGFGVSALPDERKTAVLDVVHGLTECLVWMIKKVMWIAPVGVFGLLAHAVGTFGWDVLALVAKLLVVYVGALLVQAFGVYPALVRLLTRVPASRFVRKMSKPQLVALSTSSSMATLPVTMETCQKELGVSRSTSSFVLPLGATINMDGNAIYYALVAMFFSQLFGQPLGPPELLAIVLTATIGSIGQAGVPGPTLLVVAVLLAAGLPVEGLPLLFGVDRIFDMLRTAVNITGDASCAVIVDRFADRADVAESAAVP
ncbi:MAG: dicarboxylate/amino acid:cation symporter [Deltaproteobacteria bacterium]|jgi:Na+/H+-dicarboxylate symporter|nr:dicarboxylate/amino acid:cation symporter [Deltaproteobacteria bacterium]MBW2534376.1 dicarboxylate/amino acid:cation symporter [Deltaproteobacteria bacterium]